MMDKKEYFIEGFQDFARAHRVKLVGYDEYDGEGMYCCTSYSFVGEGFEVDIRDLEKMI